MRFANCCARTLNAHCPIFVCNLISQITAAQSFPVPIRQGAERLSTKITQRDRAPFTSNPIADAKLIIAYLIRP